MANTTGFGLTALAVAFLFCLLFVGVNARMSRSGSAGDIHYSIPSHDDGLASRLDGFVSPFASLSRSDTGDVFRPETMSSWPLHGDEEDSLVRQNLSSENLLVPSSEIQSWSATSENTTSTQPSPTTVASSSIAHSMSTTTMPHHHHTTPTANVDSQSKKHPSHSRSLRIKASDVPQRDPITYTTVANANTVAQREDVSSHNNNNNNNNKNRNVWDYIQSHVYPNYSVMFLLTVVLVMATIALTFRPSFLTVRAYGDTTTTSSSSSSSTSRSFSLIRLSILCSLTVGGLLLFPYIAQYIHVTEEEETNDVTISKQNRPQQK